MHTVAQHNVQIFNRSAAAQRRCAAPLCTAQCRDARGAVPCEASSALRLAQRAR
jgi:hypothetical protein